MKSKKKKKIPLSALIRKFNSLSLNKLIHPRGPPIGLSILMNAF